ncbi:acyltransferase domain-containing protein [Pseudomonas putida]|uniref:acyltransferase domain-containing protein n=1 Tax=Pseudomonas putida TaxID=303 RepID=UPI002363A75C|nr:acyltransferase domain-containing protein [Pseudomonas putida]MDD2052491.1 acyltransferase domain-containing protein [Pseudomonas putida]
MKAWLFQGQGSQRKGMGATLFARFPEQVAEADALLGYSIERLCLEDPEQQLNLTTYTQPAIYVVSWLGYLAAREDGSVARYAAGHSVGEYAALTAAGALDFKLGLRIVIERARLMAQVEGGGLVAVLGHPRERVQQLLDELPDIGLAIANLNSPRQIIVGGTHAALERLLEHCAEHTIRAIALKVSGPFHTVHMQAVEAPFRDFLQALSAQFREPAFPVIANLQARPHTRVGMVEALSKHLTHPVQWQQVIEHLLAEGIKDFIEIGQPAILAGMLKDIREQPTAPPVAAPSALHQRLGCPRPLLVGTTGSPALLTELARQGAMGLLECAGLAEPDLKASVLGLNAEPPLRGRFGLRLDGVPHSALLAWLAKQPLACVEIPAERLAPSQWQHLREGCPQIRWLARVESADALKTSLANADGLVIAADTHLPLLLAALACQVPSGPLIGASSLIGSPASAQALFDLGVDFVIPTSVFLLCSEAGLPVEHQQRLARLEQVDHHPLLDWRFPEFASRTPGYVLDRPRGEQLEALQAFYLSSAGCDWNALQTCLARFSEPLIDTQPPAEPRPVRHELQARVLQRLEQWQLPGDASLWLFNRWRRHSQPDLPIPLPTAQLLDLLCPAATSANAPSRKTP